VTDWHGWRVSDASAANTNTHGALHIGPVPERTRVALYLDEGTQSTVLAYFVNAEAAAKALEFIDFMASAANGK
jgi:hypothetical protein